MLISDKLVFVELQKTGSTHIKTLLRDLVGGRNDGKHNTPPPELLDSGKKFVGSIRDPWAWYVSLWTYGCQQKGELFQRLTNEKKWQRVIAKGKEAVGENDKPAQGASAEPAAGGKAASKTKATGRAKAIAEDKAVDEKKPMPENWGPERAKTVWYSDPESAEAFREWLQVVLGTFSLRRLLETGYGKSPISKAGGLMTFRYFTLFVRNAETVDKSVDTVEALKEFDKKNCFIDHFIRNESLAPDFIKTLDDIGIPLTDEQRSSVLDAKKTNVSVRPKGLDYYYDEPSIQLVMRREKFIIDKFGYKNKRP